MVYHGPANRALGYFSAHGYECEEHDNPADFFLDVIIRNEEAALQKNLGAPATLQNGIPGWNTSIALYIGLIIACTPNFLQIITIIAN